MIAGYFPGVITYFSLWYPKREQSLRIAIFCCGTFFSGAYVGVLVIIFIVISSRFSTSPFLGLRKYQNE